MFYEKFGLTKDIEILEGYDINKNLRAVTRIVTDGNVIIEDENVVCENGNNIPKLNNESPVQKSLDEIVFTTRKKVVVDNASYISLIYYAFLEEKNYWSCYHAKHYVRQGFSFIDELNLIKTQGLIPFYMHTEELPEEITNRDLNEKVKTKRLLKKIEKTSRK